MLINVFEQRWYVNIKATGQLILNLCNDNSNVNILRCFILELREITPF